MRRCLALMALGVVIGCASCGDSTGGGGSATGSGEGAGGCFATFDGVDDGLVAEATGLTETESFSLSAFMRPEPPADGAIYFVAGLHKDGDNNGHYLALANEGAGTIARFVVFAASGTCTPTSALPAGDGWVHLLGSYSEGKARLFMQGELVAEVDCGPPVIDPAAAFVIGRSQSNLFAYRGDLDDVAYYAKATTEPFDAAELGCTSARLRIDFEGVTPPSRNTPDACGASAGATLGLNEQADETQPTVACP